MDFRADDHTTIPEDVINVIQKRDEYVDKVTTPLHYLTRRADPAAWWAKVLSAKPRVPYSGPRLDPPYLASGGLGRGVTIYVIDSGDYVCSNLTGSTLTLYLESRL